MPAQERKKSEELERQVESLRGRRTTQARAPTSLAYRIASEFHLLTSVARRGVQSLVVRKTQDMLGRMREELAWLAEEKAQMAEAHRGEMESLRREYERQLHGSPTSSLRSTSPVSERGGSPKRGGSSARRRESGRRPKQRTPGSGGARQAGAEKAPEPKAVPLAQGLVRKAGGSAPGAGGAKAEEQVLSGQAQAMELLRQAAAQGDARAQAALQQALAS